MKNLLTTIRSLETDEREDILGTVYDFLSLISIGTFVATFMLYAKAIASYLN